MFGDGGDFNNDKPKIDWFRRMDIQMTPDFLSYLKSMSKYIKYKTNDKKVFLDLDKVLSTSNRNGNNSQHSIESIGNFDINRYRESAS